MVKWLIEHNMPIHPSITIDSHSKIVINHPKPEPPAHTIDCWCEACFPWS